MLAVVIEAEPLVQAILGIIVAGLIFWLLHWLIGYVGLPEPFAKIAKVFLAVVAVLILIAFLMAIIGHPIIGWRK